MSDPKTPPAGPPEGPPTTGSQGRPRSRGMAREVWSVVALPMVAIAAALVVGAIVIEVSQLLLPGATFKADLPLTAYSALLHGAVLNEGAIVNTLVLTAPLVLGGLSVAIGFKAGLFNIGAQGQFLMGALGAVWVGGLLSDASPLVAIPLAVLAGMIGGALWGFIPGALKALSGAHEVVTTIMLNYIAIATLALLVSGPLKVPGSPSPVTEGVGNAGYPIIIGSNGHLGIVISVIAVVVVWFLLYRTTRGFEIRTVGANPDAGRYAGMRPRLLIVLTMSLCGLLAGLAGTGVVLGVTRSMTSSFGTTVGFDSIAVALLARSNPWAILLSALLFGGMRAGAGLMQIQARIPPELVDVLQATILLSLVMTPFLRRVFRLRGVKGGLGGTETITKTYGGEATVR